MNLAPIALFVYNRLPHTQQTVEALAKNELAADSELFVYSDGPRSEADTEKVATVRAYLATITGFKALTVVNRDENFGCARSITSGVSEIVSTFGHVIVVEDDIVTSPYFLRYMNDALDLYRDEERVACIHGYLYPLAGQLPETFFIRGADAWGWATWKRAWDIYEFDGQKLLAKITSMKLSRRLNSYGYMRILKQQIAGKIDTWDIQWCISAFINNRLTLYPGRSLTQNIGFDNSGTHCRTGELYSVKLSDTPINLSKIAIEEDPVASEAIRTFLNKTNPGITGKLLNKIWGVTRNICTMVRG